MGVFITISSLGLFLLVMAIYKICQTAFLGQDKSKLEAIGFLSDDVLSFLEFAVLIVTFLAVESLFLMADDRMLLKGLFLFACFCLFVCDDIVLYKKLKK